MRKLAVAALFVSLVACDGDDDPTGLEDLADVAGRTFELVGIGTIGGYRDSAPGTLYTGACPGQPGLREETDFREAELTFTADSFALRTEVRRHCYDPDAEVIVPDWGPLAVERFSRPWSLQDDRLLMGQRDGATLYGYLDDGRLRVEFEPSTGSIGSGNVLIFE